MANLEPTAWIESYEITMDMMDVSSAVCAKYLTMTLEGPAHTWQKNLHPNSINTWAELKDHFIKKNPGNLHMHDDNC